MNLSEFKAWFEGFTEEMDGPPNAKQWKKIKARVDEITSDPTPWPVVVDRYIRPAQSYQLWPYWPQRQYTMMQTGNTSAPQGMTNTSAFNMVGQADAKMIETDNGI